LILRAYIDNLSRLKSPFLRAWFIYQVKIIFIEFFIENFDYLCSFKVQETTIMFYLKMMY